MNSSNSPSTANLDNLRVVLVATRNPLNIGAAARAMSNFGAAQLRVVNPYEIAFREARSAVGAAQLLANAKEYESVAESVADCSLVIGTTAATRRALQLELRRLEGGARTIRRQFKTAPVAILFGSEKVGLSNEDMSHCHWLMRIPTREDHGSMNLGQAVAVCLYELTRETKGAAGDKAASRIANGRAQEETTKAKAGDLERLTQLLLDVLDASGYTKPGVARATEEKLRRMLRRLRLSTGDAELWLGMLRQIQWKLDKNEEPNRSQG
ncbi:MAG: TrmJ/YjtD family RNA methyltransferase [Terriglobales bacterium]